MLSEDAILFLFSILGGLLLGLTAWGLLQVRWRNGRNDWIGPGDETSSSDETLLLGLLVVAAFALGAFITYALLGLRL